jgi:hypothetical protein
MASLRDPPQLLEVINHNLLFKDAILVANLAGITQRLGLGDAVRVNQQN